MMDPNSLIAPSRTTPKTHRRGADKVARIPVKVEAVGGGVPLRKPPWIRTKVPLGSGVARIKRQLRAGKLITVCEEARCSNNDLEGFYPSHHPRSVVEALG